MIQHIKSFILNLLAGANVVTVVLMLLVGYSDHLHPESYPMLACAGMVFPFFLLANLLFLPVWVLLSWKRLLIPVIGFMLVFPALRVYLPLHGQSQPPEGALRVATYNVCTFGGNYKYEHAYDTIFNYLHKQKVDIVCMQEANSTKGQIDYTAYYPYSDTTIVSIYMGTPNVVGLFSNFPILKKEIINYSSPTNGSVAYYLKVDDDTIIVINNHLESSHLNDKDRNRYEEMIKGDMERDAAKTQTKELVSKLSEAMVIRAGHADSIYNYMERHRQYPLIVCGDFNDTPISYVRHRISEGMTDCYVETGCGPGVSFNRRGFNFRIDHMMCSSHFTPYGGIIDDEMDASDHYPLLCWLKFKGK